MVMRQFQRHVYRMQCLGLCGYVFNLAVEQTDDVQMSHVTDGAEPTGYAIFRNKFLVQCPRCKGACRIIPGEAHLDVKFTPSKG